MAPTKQTRRMSTRGEEAPRSRNPTSQTDLPIDIPTLKTNLGKEISALQSNVEFLKSYNFQEGWVDGELLLKILQKVQKFNSDFDAPFEKSLHRLGKYKPSMDAVEKLVKKFPSALSYQDEDGQIPIQTAANDDGFEYVPLLAKEGFKHKVGGEHARGGLLKVDDDGRNILQLLLDPDLEVVNVENNNAAKRLDVLKELQRLRLLLPKDVQEHSLLQFACSNYERFEFLVSLDPDALAKTKVGNVPLIHYMRREDNSIRLLLKAGFEHHPNIGGLLFIEDDNGTSAFESLCDEHGEEKMMNILHGILSPKRDFPILHHVFIKAQQHKQLFTKKFPWAYHLKDHDGRTLQQSILAAGPEVMNVHDELFASLTDDQIQMKDPVTTLFPFAAMAVGEHADLEKCFYMLLRQPSVLENRPRATRNEPRRKKRKVSK
ncbi:hypothetical protein CTEN210_13679 [Chaetoceros tenuissimus]|uniref:Uncharacterized protein n=1 Tax=Chaetoceros tenuissimus TaxID=426638 RepID=A0AAD3D3Q4_9STRA|nr:hypothetical protein CTEN210_13679 [Chaetoceros tenuissimus]